MSPLRPMAMEPHSNHMHYGNLLSETLVFGLKWRLQMKNVGGVRYGERVAAGFEITRLNLPTADKCWLGRLTDDALLAVLLSNFSGKKRVQRGHLVQI